MDKINDELSNEFALLVHIYEQTEIHKNIITYSDLKKQVDWMTEKEISICLSKCYDKGMINAAWCKKGNLNVYSIFIDERFSGFVQGLYNVVSGSDNKKKNNIDGERDLSR